MNKRVLILIIGLAITNVLIAMPNDPCLGQNPPPRCPTIPIDTHVLWLFGFGILFIAYRIYKINKLKLS